MKISPSKIKKWIAAKATLAAAKPEEMDLRKELCDAILGDTQEGKVKYVSAAGELEATAKITTSLDPDITKEIWEDLSEEEQKCITWKPSLVQAKFKKLKSQTLIHTAITTKPAAPTLTLKPK